MSEAVTDSQDLTCFVPGCSEETAKRLANSRCKPLKKPPLFKPPQELLKFWNSRIPNKTRELTENDAICGLHFAPSDIEVCYTDVTMDKAKPKLKKHAIPSTFPTISETTEVQKPAQAKIQLLNVQEKEAKIPGKKIVYADDITDTEKKDLFLLNVENEIKAYSISNIGWKKKQIMSSANEDDISKEENEMVVHTVCKSNGTSDGEQLIEQIEQTEDRDSEPVESNQINVSMTSSSLDEHQGNTHEATCELPNDEVEITSQFQSSVDNAPLKQKNNQNCSSEIEDCQSIVSDHQMNIQSIITPKMITVTTPSISSNSSSPESYRMSQSAGQQENSEGVATNLETGIADNTIMDQQNVQEFKLELHNDVQERDSNSDTKVNVFELDNNARRGMYGISSRISSTFEFENSANIVSVLSPAAHLELSGMNKLKPRMRPSIIPGQRPRSAVTSSPGNKRKGKCNGESPRVKRRRHKVVGNLNMEVYESLEYLLEDEEIVLQNQAAENYIIVEPTPLERERRNLEMMMKRRKKKKKKKDFVYYSSDDDTYLSMESEDDIHDSNDTDFASSASENSDMSLMVDDNHVLMEGNKNDSSVMRRRAASALSDSGLASVCQTDQTLSGDSGIDWTSADQTLYRSQKSAICRSRRSQQSSKVNQSYMGDVKIEDSRMTAKGSLLLSGNKMDSDQCAEVTSERKCMTENKLVLKNLSQIKESDDMYNLLWEAAGNTRLPSLMWSVHKEPNKRFIAFAHVSSDTSVVKFSIDKTVKFENSSHPLIFLRGVRVNTITDIPDELESIEQLTFVLRKVDKLVLCTGLKFPVVHYSANCKIYLERGEREMCKSCVQEHKRFQQEHRIMVQLEDLQS